MCNQGTRQWVEDVVGTIFSRPISSHLPRTLLQVLYYDCATKSTQFIALRVFIMRVFAYIVIPSTDYTPLVGGEQWLKTVVNGLGGRVPL